MQRQSWLCGYKTRLESVDCQAQANSEGDRDWVDAARLGQGLANCRQILANSRGDRNLEDTARARQTSVAFSVRRQETSLKGDPPEL